MQAELKRQTETKREASRENMVDNADLGRHDNTNEVLEHPRLAPTAACQHMPRDAMRKGGALPPGPATHNPEQLLSRRSSP